MSNTMDLIPLARAYQNLPSLGGSGEDTALASLITAASKAIQRYCSRDFVVCTYDELYNGNGDRRLFLRQFPIQSVQAVRYRPVTVLRITNTNGAANQQARVSVTGTGLTLFRMASGVASTDTSVTFAGNVTLQAVANAVNTLGNGWSAQVEAGYSLWPSADLWCLNGNATNPELNAMAGQGALNAVSGVFAELKMHTFELSGYQIDQRRGWLLRAIPYTDPELLHPEDLIWPTGIDNFRIQYTAGYSTIPEDVQEACAELVASYFKMFDQNQLLARETAGGVTRIELKEGQTLPQNVAALLAPYRQRRMATFQS
jgi:hypothetical protein